MEQYDKAELRRIIHEVVAKLIRIPDLSEPSYVTLQDLISMGITPPKA